MEILVKAVFSIADAVEVGEYLADGGTAIVNLSGASWFDREDAIAVLKDAAVRVPYQVRDEIYLFAGEGVTVSDTL